MKTQISVLVLVAALSGCSSVYVPKIVEVPIKPTTSVQTPPASYRLAASHWSDVSKIRDEATRLSYQVSQGQITKAQAAQYLDRFRINLVGRNAVDDDMYQIYLRSVVDSQRGAINTEQSNRWRTPKNCSNKRYT